MASISRSHLPVEDVTPDCKPNMKVLQCSICHNILWKPVACKTCETSYCSSCIDTWISKNPNNCPMRCRAYIQGKCSIILMKLLAELTIICYYKDNGCTQIVPYEAVEKHEAKCDYQKIKCTACQSIMLKKNFNHHENTCGFIKLTCENCQLVYRRNEATFLHTESMCLKNQLRQMKSQIVECKNSINALHSQIDKDSDKHEEHIDQIQAQMEAIFDFLPIIGQVEIQFRELETASKNCLLVPDNYKGFTWKAIYYNDLSYIVKQYPKSGYATCFNLDNKLHMAWFDNEASIKIKQNYIKFNFISITACAAWNDDLMLTIKGYRDSRKICETAEKLDFGRPKLILLRWKDIDYIIFHSSNGIPHPGSGRGNGNQVIITALNIEYTVNK